MRGAKLTMIGCLDFGSAEGGRVYRVDVPGKAPFSVAINFRSAAMASQGGSAPAAPEAPCAGSAAANTSVAVNNPMLALAFTGGSQTRTSSGSG